MSFLDYTSTPPLIASGHEKKLTQADFSEFLAPLIVWPKKALSGPILNGIVFPNGCR